RAFPTRRASDLDHVDAVPQLADALATLDLLADRNHLRVEVSVVGENATRMLDQNVAITRVTLEQSSPSADDNAISDGEDIHTLLSALLRRIVIPSVERTIAVSEVRALTSALRNRRRPCHQLFSFSSSSDSTLT